MKRLLTQYPAISESDFSTRPISSLPPLHKTSSASSNNTHSFRNGRLARAQFFFFGQPPLYSNWTTLAPKFFAIWPVASVLFESTMNFSDAHATDLRQRSRLSSSFLVGIKMLTGTLISLFL